MGFGNAQVRKHMGNDLRFHTGTTIRMDGQLTGLNVLFNTGLLYESFGQGILFPVSDHPSEDV